MSTAAALRTNFLDGSSLSVVQTRLDDYSATAGDQQKWRSISLSTDY
jgi:hypothetical protein